MDMYSIQIKNLGILFEFTKYPPRTISGMIVIGRSAIATSSFGIATEIISP